MEKLNLFDDSGLDHDSDPDLVHYQGELGDFWYNPEEFTVDIFRRGESLHYCGKGKAVELPKGCINTRGMFYECRYDNISFREYFKTDDMKSIIALLKQ